MTERSLDARGAATLAVVLGLAGCQQTGIGDAFGGVLSPAPPTERAAAAPGAVEEVEVEAPDVYSLTAPGLWDGRPSLGGVWVAHPDVSTPERVVIRSAGGGTVTGALFRRERASAGPPFQISSEAATALGIPPGTSAELEVVALRREARAVPTPAPAPDPSGTPQADTAAALASAAGTVTAVPLDPAIGAAVASADAVPPAIEPPAAPSARGVAANPAPAIRPPGDAVVVAPGAIDAPFVQVGFFAEEEGAAAAADRLRAAGIETRIALADTGARRLWRLVAGPAETLAARDDLISAIRAEGYERPVPVGS